MLETIKYPRTFHIPASPGLQNDDRVTTTLDDIIGHNVIATEKIDGGNTCLFKGEVYARSTSAPSTASWFAMVKKHHAWKTRNVQDYIFYGEDIYGVHSISYEAVNESETFNLFAVRRSEGGFLAWDDVEYLASLYDMPIVPTLFNGVFKTEKDLNHWCEEKISEGSALGGQCEGFVIRRADYIPEEEFSSKVLKYVRAGHVQTDQHWTKNWKTCNLIR